MNAKYNISGIPDRKIGQLGIILAGECVHSGFGTGLFFAYPSALSYKVLKFSFDNATVADAAVGFGAFHFFKE